MPHVERSTDIAASPEEVWKWIVEPEKILRWNEAIKKCEIIEEKEDKIGTVYSMDQEIHDKINTYKFIILEWTENERVVFGIKSEEGDVRAKRSYTLRPTERGCRVILEEDLELKGLIGRILGALFAKKKLIKYREYMLMDLKEVVEKGSIE
ncbi:MAG: SRPBCC family protein [Euryarchaeota archaeon]|nr:SRPBCC family protein [Euryarchaeota archaeon]